MGPLLGCGSNGGDGVEMWAVSVPPKMVMLRKRRLRACRRLMSQRSEGEGEEAKGEEAMG